MMSKYQTIRVNREDSVFVYAVLESHEGICSYSTLPHAPASRFRDIELQIPPDFVEDVNLLMNELSQSIDIVFANQMA